MKQNHTIKILFILIMVCSLFISCKKSKKEVDQKRLSQVIVYTYDSFSGEWGPGPEIARLFFEKTGLNVVYSDCGDGVEILSKAIIEKSQPYADVLLGLDNNLIKKVEESEVLSVYEPKNRDVIPENLKKELGEKWLLTPFDYSPFAIIYNKNSNLEKPTCLEDLTKEIYNKKIILMDPRTSTPGLGFETWVKKVYGSNYEDYMNRLKPSVLTITPGWSVGYGMFTEGEAPLVISYVTSPAYHIEYNEGDNFVALEFTDGHVMQVEGAGIVKNCQNPEGAKAFIDFLISEEAQSIIPLTQWMYPVNKNVTLPKSYETLINPRIIE